MAFISWILISSGVVALCRARLLNCTTSQDGDKTEYTISHTHFQGSDKGCDYSWTNAGRQVLAHEMQDPDQRHELVKTSSINALVTYECLSPIFYKRSCISEGVEHTAICIISCKENDPIQEVKERSHSWMALTAFLGLACFVVLCFARAKYIQKEASRSRLLQLKQTSTLCHSFHDDKFVSRVDQNTAGWSRSVRERTGGRGAGRRESGDQYTEDCV